MSTKRPSDSHIHKIQTKGSDEGHLLLNTFKDDDEHHYNVYKGEQSTNSPSFIIYILKKKNK